tara:strand:- start:53 stop:460 length:408 start_codon:yes stop_codon:yes gene_type:complete
MDKKFLKKIIAQSPEDLQIISACCSEAKVKISEIKYLSSSKMFLLSLLRIDKENEKNKNLISSVIKFEFIDSSKSKNINQNNPNMLLELLAIDIFKKNHNFEITLLFSKNRFITLSTEIVDVTLEDQNLKDDKSN